MKTRNLYRIIIGALILISGIVVILMTPGDVNLGTILLATGLVFLIVSITNHRKYGDDPESDERSKKISAYGLSRAWLTALFFMYGLFWLDYLNVLKLSAQNALIASIFVLGVSAMIYQVYLFRKGDVE